MCDLTLKFPIVKFAIYCNNFVMLQYINLRFILLKQYYLSYSVEK
jgi:hypothetical protein